MSIEKGCKYYLDSRCILEGGYCDLNCNRLSNPQDSEFCSNIDTLDQPQIGPELGLLYPTPILPKWNR